MKTQNPLAVITGASSGIGKAFACELAKTHDLVLIARRKKLLDAISRDLRVNGNNITVYPADLANERDLIRLESALMKRKVDVLVNAAGFGDPNTFESSNSGLIHDMVYVHVMASTRLSRLVLSGMIEQNHGVIINVASVSGFSKVYAGNLIYDSLKAYLIRFSELLQQSIDPKNNVKIQVLCPGFTETDFFSKHQHKVRIPRFLWMKAEDVVKRSLRKIKDKKTVYIPGILNNMIAGIIRSSLLFPFLKMVKKWAV